MREKNLIKSDIGASWGRGSAVKGQAGDVAQQLRALSGFSSLHPHGDSQSSESPVPEDLKHSSDLHGHQACS